MIMSYYFEDLEANRNMKVIIEEKNIEIQNLHNQLKHSQQEVKALKESLGEENG